MHKLAIAVIILFTLFGSTSLQAQQVQQSQQSQQTFDDDQNRSFARGGMVRSYRANGTRIFCDQPAYLKCLSISRTQCMAELEDYRLQCVDTNWGKVDEDMSGESLNQFGINHAKCLTSKHLSIHREKATEISACFNTMKFDKKQAFKSLMEE